MQLRSASVRLGSNAFLQGLCWLVVGTVVFAFRLREAVFGPGSLFRGYDGAIQSYAWLTKVINGWRSFQPSLWDFGTFSGTSFVGELQTGVFYPMTAIWAWIAPPTPFWLEAYVVFHHGLAFAFMTILCRELRLSLPASLLAALAFSSYLDWSQPNRMFGMAFLPLLLFFYVKASKSRSWPASPWIFAGGAALACSLLAGHHQPPIHSAFTLALFAAFHAGGSWPKRLWIVCGVGFSAVLFSAPQLWLSWEYLGNAYRWTPVRIPALSPVSYQQYGFENTLNPQLLHYFTESWIPVVALAALVLLFVDQSPERKRLARFGLILGGVSLAASLGDASLVGRLTWHVPVLNLVRETERFLFPFLFAAAMLLAVSLDGMVQSLERRSPLFKDWIPVLLGLVAGVGLWWHSAGFLYIQPPDDPLSPVRLYPDLRGSEPTPSAAVLKFLSQRFEAESGQCRVLNLNDSLPPNMGDVYSIHSTSGHRATMHAPYFDFLREDGGDSPYDQLGACYLVTTESMRLPLLLREDDLAVYRRPGALPVLGLEETATGTRTAIPARIDWGINRVDLALDRPVEGRLVFAQMKYPGWEIRVDGEARPHAPSEHFLAVDLTSADGRVSFLYRPVGLLWSMVAALSALVGWCVCGWANRRRPAQRC